MFAVLFVGVLAATPSALAASGPDRVASADMPGAPASASGLQRGIVNHVVPFEVPPAPGGVVPDLSLVMDPGVSQGWLGPGWTLTGFSRIERQTLVGGVPSFDDAPDASADIFLLDGQRLWDTSASLPSAAWPSFWSTVVWQPELQDGRAVDYDGVDNVFRVRQNGWTWEYGDGSPGLATERVTEGQSGDSGTDGASTSAWLLSAVTDPYGNTLTVTYATPAGAVAVDALSGDYVVAHVPALVSFGGANHATVELGWASRDDTELSARGGRLRVTTSRLETVSAFVDGTPYAAYSLEYVDESELPCSGEEASSPSDDVSVLKRVWREAVDGSGGARQLRCIETDDSDASWAEDATYGVTGWPSSAAGGARSAVANFDGDAWQDVVQVVLACDAGTDADDWDTYVSCSSVDVDVLGGALGALAGGGAGGAEAMLSPVLTPDFFESDVSAGDEGGGHALVDLDRNGTTDLVVGGGAWPEGAVFSLQADGTSVSDGLALTDGVAGPQQGGAYRPSDLVLDTVQIGLAGIGLVPGVGELADGLDVAISLARGDYIGAAMGAPSLIPGAGVAAGGMKIAGKVASIATGLKQLAGASQAATVVFDKARDAERLRDASEGAASRILQRTPRDLQKGFTKHGADFGLEGNWNPSRGADFSRAVHQHINDPGVKAIQGTYRGDPVTHYVNPETGLNVIADPAGNYVSGWQLGAEQLEGVLTTGRLY